MNSIDNLRTQTAVVWLAVIGLVLLLGLAGGQDRAGEEAEAHERAAAIHRASR